MELISRPEYLDSLFQSNQLEIDLISNKVDKNNPFYKFPIDILRTEPGISSKKAISQTSRLLKPYFDQDTAMRRISLHVENRGKLAGRDSWYCLQLQTFHYPPG